MFPVKYCAAGCEALILQHCKAAEYLTHAAAAGQTWSVPAAYEPQKKKVPQRRNLDYERGSSVCLTQKRSTSG